MTETRVDLKQLLRSKRKRRDRKYVHHKGEFLLTASFRRPVDRTRIALVGALVQHFTQATRGDMLGVSSSTVGKMVRIFYAGHR